MHNTYEQESYSRMAVSSLIDAPLNDLFMMLGEKIYERYSYAIEPTEDQLLATGKKWLKNNVTKICNALNKSKTIKSYVYKKSSYERYEVVCEIADILITLNIGFPVLIPSLIVFRQGILEICRPKGFFL